MRFIRILLVFIVHVVLLAVAIDFLVALNRIGLDGATPMTTNSFLSELAPRWFDSANKLKLWAMAGIALVIISWLTALLAIRIRPRPLQVRTTQGDTLLLDPSAIINFTHAQVENHPAVTKHRVDVRQVGGKTVAITAHLKVIPINSLPEIKRELETQLRDAFSQVLGIEKVEAITLILGLDEKNITRRPGPAIKPEPPVPVPARGTLEPTDNLDRDLTLSSPGETSPNEKY